MEQLQIVIKEVPHQDGTYKDVLPTPVGIFTRNGANLKAAPSRLELAFEPHECLGKPHQMHFLKTWNLDLPRNTHKYTHALKPPFKIAKKGKKKTQKGKQAHRTY